MLAIDDDLIKNLVKALGKKRRFDDPTKATISPRTINTYIHQVQAVLNHVRDDLKIPLPDAPTWSKHLRETEQRTRVISARELTSIEAEADEDLWNCIEFSLESAIRKTAAALLTWDQVDWEAGVIRFRNKARSRGKRKAKGQVRQIREVNLTDRIAEILHAQEGKHETAVFTFVARRTFLQWKSGTHYVEGQRYPMTVASYTRSYRELCDRLGIQDLTIHDLRRSRGSFVYRATGSLGHAQHTLKHATHRQTEEAYAFMTTAETGRAMEAGTAFSDAMVEAFKARTGRVPGRRRPGKVPEETGTTAITSYGSMVYQATSTFTRSTWMFALSGVRATYLSINKALLSQANFNTSVPLSSNFAGLAQTAYHQRTTQNTTNGSDHVSEFGGWTDLSSPHIKVIDCGRIGNAGENSECVTAFYRLNAEIALQFQLSEAEDEPTYARERFRRRSKQAFVFAHCGSGHGLDGQATDDEVDRLYGRLVDARRKARRTTGFDPASQ